MRQVTGQYLPSLPNSSVFGNNTVSSCFNQSGILSGCSIRWLRHLNIALHMPLLTFSNLNSALCWFLDHISFSFLEHFAKLLFSDHEFLHIHNFWSCFLCIYIHPFSLWSIRAAIPDSCLELFKLFHLRYLPFQLLRSLSFYGTFLGLPETFYYYIPLCLWSLCVSNICYNILIYQVISPLHILALHFYSAVGLLIYSVFAESNFPFYFIYFLSSSYEFHLKSKPGSVSIL